MNDIITPSGAVYGKREQKLVAWMLHYGTVSWSDQPIRLFGGADTHIYINGRTEITLHPQYGKELLVPIYQSICQRSDKTRRPIVLGIPTAGTSIATTLQGIENVSRFMIGSQIMRERKKKHGSDAGWVSGGCLQNHATYFVVENTITSGRSYLAATRRLSSDGFDLTQISFHTLISRSQSALEGLSKRGFAITPAYHLEDILFVTERLGLWPRDRIVMAQREIFG